MKEIEKELLILKDLLSPIIVSCTPQKKRYINAVMDKIISEINRREIDVLNLEAKLNGFGNRNDYMTEMRKYQDILILMGIGSTPLNIMRYDVLRWICEHNEEQKRPFTFNELWQVHRMLVIHDGLEDKFPESLTELKEYFKDDKS